jgi:hypothetical protein
LANFVATEPQNARIPVQCIKYSLYQLSIFVEISSASQIFQKHFWHGLAAGPAEFIRRNFNNLWGYP